MGSSSSARRRRRRRCTRSTSAPTPGCCDGRSRLWLGRDNPNELPSQMVGREAPNLTIIPLSDLPFLDETDLKAPNIKIVNFWASWCAPCRVEHPNIQQLSDLGFIVHGINYKDTSLTFASPSETPFLLLATPILICSGRSNIWILEPCFASPLMVSLPKLVSTST